MTFIALDICLGFLWTFQSVVFGLELSYHIPQLCLLLFQSFHAAVTLAIGSGEETFAVLTFQHS